MSTALRGHSAPLVVAFSCLVVALLRHALSLRFVLLRHRQQQQELRSSSRSFRLTRTWHVPLLLMGFTLAASRLAFFHTLHTTLPEDVGVADDAMRQRLWLTAPGTIWSILCGYLVGFHAHVVLFREWPARGHRLAISMRVLLAIYSALLLSITVLMAYARATTPSQVLPSRDWDRVELSFHGTVWIIVGALLLKFQGMSAELLWRECDAGRPVVLSPRAVHRLLVAETLFALVVILRGGMATMLAMASTETTEAVQPSDVTSMSIGRFLALYGVWEMVALATVYRLCSVVPAISRAQCSDTTESSDGSVIISDPRQRPIVHVCVPSPREAVAEYLRPASLVVASHARITRRGVEDTDRYTPIGDAIDSPMANAHEPLLSTRDSDQESDDELTYYY